MTQEHEQEQATAIVEYSPTAAGLAELRGRLAGVVYDVSTPKGIDAARKDRRECVTLRTSLEAMRVKIKAPALERCRLIDAEAKRITEAIAELEQPIDSVIKAEEQRRENEKRAREELERKRVATIHQRIDWIRALPIEHVGKSSAEIVQAIGTLNGLPITDELYAELLAEANEARAESLRRLGEMHAAALGQETERVKLAEERAALERDQAAEAERQAAARRAEDQRAGIARRIEAIRNLIANGAGKSSAVIAEMIASLRAQLVNVTTFGEHQVDEAEAAKRDALAKLNELLVVAKNAEDERADLDRQKREQDERERAQREEQQRLDAQRAQQEAEAQRQRDAADRAAQRRERIKAHRYSSEAEALYAIVEACEDENLSDAQARDEVLVICEANLPERQAAAA